MAAPSPDDVLRSRLGYLLKHAYGRLAEEIGTALRPLGIDSRELAVLVLLDATDTPLSQLEVARRLGIDRTTMMQFTDLLEGKGLLARRRSPEDRRKNIVELTPLGQERLAEAERLRADAEARFLEPLGANGSSLIEALRTLTR
ncbi:MarR family winged helix-turn-helix transcriptional regulator [Nocardia sp. CDC160]|uniref:MarR family winged helix-turn-helix transcriptional regulator n=1 Tax=Nocardia sp. CDC160 TaxID=3112166 RepID=UPI002DBB33E0|nr:MarR family transcriptional regulator [Nocardia sp. CDC160]MEC3917297.1 MarR family transcriptional regulator [Nocardia sp. CDC160]